MTKDEFQKRVQKFQGSKEAAEQEADELNRIGIENDKAVAVDFGVFGWSVTLESTRNLTDEILFGRKKENLSVLN